MISQLELFELHSELEVHREHGRLLYAWACMEGTDRVLYEYGKAEDIEHARILGALTLGQ